MSPPFVLMIAFVILTSYTSEFAADADDFCSYKNGVTRIFEEYGKFFISNIAVFFDNCINVRATNESALIYCIAYAVDQSKYIMNHFANVPGKTNAAKYFYVIFNSLDVVHDAQLQRTFEACLSLDIPRISADDNVLRCVVVVAKRLNDLYEESTYPEWTYFKFVEMVRINATNLFSELKSDYPLRQSKDFFDNCMSRPYSGEKDDRHLLRCINQGIIAFMDRN